MLLLCSSACADKFAYSFLSIYQLSSLVLIATVHFQSQCFYASFISDLLCTSFLIICSLSDEISVFLPSSNIFHFGFRARACSVYKNQIHSSESLSIAPF